MGTEFWLVDREGRNALDVDKWYGLANAVYDSYTDGRTLGHVVTPEMVRACFCPRGEWLRTAALLWMERVAGGRPVELWDDQTDDEWEGYDDERDFYAMPGWTLYDSHTPPRHPLWRPPEVEAALAARPTT